MGPHPQSTRPPLKLFAAEPRGDDSSLSPHMTLASLMRVYFEPVVLVAEGRDRGTVASYWESLGWWQALTGDPPIQAIDDYTLADFKTRLRDEATWKRGPAGSPQRLSKATQIKHLRQLRTLITVAFNKGLLAEMPRLLVGKVKGRPKPHFSVDDARRIVAAAPHMPRARRRLWNVEPGDWWQAVVLVLFYTGLRIGTVLELRRSMLARDDRYPGPYLKIPGELIDEGGETKKVVKTRNDVDKYLHPLAWQAIQRLATPDRIFPWPHCRRHLIDRHEHLQRLAGIAADKLLSPQAWRRTHSTEMAKLGADYGRRIAQQTLDHADQRTTSQFYVDIEAHVIARLPPLVDEPPPRHHGPRQLELFGG